MKPHCHFSNVVLLALFSYTGYSQSAQVTSSGYPVTAVLTTPKEPQEKPDKKIPPSDFVGYEKAPEVIKKVEPKYPGLALKSALEGNVFLKVWVSETGDVVDAQVIKSDNKIFEEAAMDAAKQWKFKPALAAGKPVAVWVSIPFRFRLSSAKSGDLKVFIESLQSITSNIILGRDMNAAKSSISSDAYVIDENQYESLYAVLNGETTKCKVVEGPDTKIDFVHTHLSDDMSTASMVLKAVSADGKHIRYNTIEFTRLSGGEWKIASWHVSG